MNNTFPSILTYTENLQKISKILNAPIDICRDKFGLFSTQQWDNLFLITKGQLCLENGFNLKTKIEIALKKLSLPIPIIKFQVSSAYQKKDINPNL